MLKIIIFLICISKALTLKCYVCETIENPECFELENVKTAFLQECQPDETKCALLVDLRINENIKRKCVKPNWHCETHYKCQNCTTDGCNEGIEIKEENILADVEEVSELLIANIYGVSVIAFVVFVLIIWCIIRKCSKKETLYYDDEDYEDDYEEYYENEV